MMLCLLFNTQASNLVLFGLLDMSTAFYMVDYQILLKRLDKTFGIRQDTLKWISYYLSTQILLQRLDKTFQIRQDTLKWISSLYQVKHNLFWCKIPAHRCL